MEATILRVSVKPLNRRIKWSEHKARKSETKKGIKPLLECLSEKPTLETYP
jgi:hypothetical protein